MKKLLSIGLMTIVVMACVKKEVSMMPAISKADLETAVIYEANIRQYSPEGTFEKFTKDIPELKKLGVKILWLMPIFPISQTNRKATGGADSKFASEFPLEEQSKYLGSYYAISDYTKINPEFGTIEDFRELITTARTWDLCDIRLGSQSYGLGPYLVIDTSRLLYPKRRRAGYSPKRYRLDRYRRFELRQSENERTDDFGNEILDPTGRY